MTRGRARGSCLIILNGEIPDRTLVRRAAKTCREIICADGAVGRADALALRPDFIVGDMDSLPARVRTRRGTTFWCDFDANRSDFQKCLDFAKRRGFTQARVAGALGGRLDHAVVNLALAEQASMGLDVVLLDRGTGRLLGPGVHKARLAQGSVFSLLPLSRARVSLSGCAYPLRKVVLERSSRGLGNRAVGGTVVLSIHSGRLWFFQD